MVIGLEIHVQLATNSKIFSGSSTKFGAEPNTQANEVDLGMPGVLPVLNEKAVEMAVKFGCAIGAEIAPINIFARKNYFYPDLPKGYQISQMDLPIVGLGEVTIDLEDGTSKKIGITRAHLEEDAGKSLHEEFHDSTGIDLNRAGTPLLEIVSEPDLRSAADAVAYAKKIHSIVRYLEIGDANMQEGSFRMDVNISLRPEGQEEYGTRAEIKNLNSFRFMEKAIAYEFERQAEILEDGGQIIQETRLYNVANNITKSMRSKEEANDYRYFPDPDLLPVEISKEMILSIKNSLPELAEHKKNRYIKDLGLSPYTANLISLTRETANYYEQIIENNSSLSELAANWIIGELSPTLKKHDLTIEQSLVNSQQFKELLIRIEDETISGKIARTVFEEMWDTNKSADDIIESRGLKQITDTAEIEKMVEDIINSNPEQVAQLKDGKTKLIGFFVGQVMKTSQGKANPAQINKILKQKLSL